MTSEMVNSVSGFVSATSAVALIYTTLKIYQEQQKFLRQNSAPGVLIDSLKTYKNNEDSNEVPEDNKYYRMYHGDLFLSEAAMDDITFHHRVPLVPLNDAEVKLFEEHSGKAFLCRFRKKPSLVICLNYSTENIIVENHIRVRLVNSGSPVQTVRLNYMLIEYKDGTKKFLEKAGENLQTHTLKNDGFFELNFVEVTNNFRGSICKVEQTVYEHMPEVFDLLSEQTVGICLTYKQIIGSFTFYTSLDGIAYSYNIILKNKDNSVIPIYESTTEKQIKKDIEKYKSW